VRQNLIAKMVILGGLAMVFAVVLLSIAGIVADRKRYHTQVVSEVAASTAQPQTLVGPALVIRFRERVDTMRDGKRETRIQPGEVVVLPESLSVRSNVGVEERRRGIYSAQVYRAQTRVEGVFKVPPRLGLAPNRILEGVDAASLTIGVDDLRGLRKPPTVTWRGIPARVEPGSNVAWIPKGVSANVGPLTGTSEEVAPFTVDVELVGTDVLSIAPIGGITQVEMESDWPHPSFVGSFLPDERRIDAKGFRASWTLSRFATGVDDKVEGTEREAQRELIKNSLGVRFIRPVDIYQQSERAVKYGMLFVLLTFLIFLMFEVLRQLLVHPIQYGLAGAAVAIFFLLLVSLSELLPFGLAYLIASSACVGLLTFYVGHVLEGFARGLGFGAFLTVLYAVLYVLLRIDDYALLIGSMLLFGVIAAVMVITRRVDWYRVGEAERSPADPKIQT